MQMVHAHARSIERVRAIFFLSRWCQSSVGHKASHALIRWEKPFMVVVVRSDGNVQDDPCCKWKFYISSDGPRTHTRSYGAGQLNEGWPWRWRDDQPTPTKGPPGRSQRQQKKDSNNNKGGGESKKQGEGKKTAASGTTSTTGSALVGAGFGMRFAFDEQQRTTRKHKRRRGTQQGREGNKHTPDPGNNQGQPEGKKKAESEHPGRPTTEAATVGRGTNNPLQAWKRHQRPNATKPPWGRHGPT